MLIFTSTNKLRLFLNVISITTLCSAFISIIFFSAAGLIVGEDVRGNLAFGLIVASTLSIISIVFAYGTTLIIQNLVRMGWALISLISLVLALYIITLNDPEAYKAADAVLVITMYILSFPISMAITFIIYIYSMLFMVNRETGITDLIFFWIIFFVSGYLQWFKLIPFLVKKIHIFLYKLK